MILVIKEVSCISLLGQHSKYVKIPLQIKSKKAERKVFQEWLVWLVVFYFSKEGKIFIWKLRFGYF